MYVQYLLNTKEQILLFCPVSYFSYKSTGEKVLKYQENSPWMVVTSLLVILITSAVE